MTVEPTTLMTRVGQGKSRSSSRTSAERDAVAEHAADAGADEDEKG